MLYSLQDSMQHAAWTFNPSDIQLDLAKHTSFWWEGFLDISNHLPDSSICIIGQSDLVNSLIFADALSWITQLLTLGASLSFSQVSWLLNFIE